MKSGNVMIFYFILIAICRSQLIYSNFYGSFTLLDFDWTYITRDSHGYDVQTCGQNNLVILYESPCSWSYISLLTKTFELPSHNFIILSFNFWIINSINNGYLFYIYIDNQIIRVIDTSLHTPIDECSSTGLYKVLEINENITHWSTSVQITMISDFGKWGISEFQIHAGFINFIQQNLELIYQSLNPKQFSIITQEDGWITNNLNSLDVLTCSDFDYLKSKGNNLMKDFVLKDHQKINFDMKVLVFNLQPTSIEIKIDNLMVINYNNQNSYVTYYFCDSFIIITVYIKDFRHDKNILRIEVITEVDGSSSWFGIRDFQLYIKDQLDYFCKDYNIQPFDGCFSNYYDCNEGCSNCIKGQCFKCSDGWMFDIVNTCIPICGDQKLMLNEVCDDGNNAPFDGCHNCQFSCPLNCNLCIFGKCQVCEQTYFLQQNKCQQQISGTFILQLETDFYYHYHMINYIINGYKWQFNYREQSILQQSYYYNIGQDNQQQIHILQGFSNCKFQDYRIFEYYYSYGQSILIENFKELFFETCLECEVGYQPSLSKKQCIQNCNCEDLIISQSIDCYICRQNCQIACLVCFQNNCQVCLDGWQLINNKCEQICGDHQVALQSIEQCDNGNQQIDDVCVECRFYCGEYCLICRNELICNICQGGFELVNDFCQPICGDKIVILGLEECDDGNNIQYDGCFECQFQCYYGFQVCKSGKCQDICRVDEEFINDKGSPINPIIESQDLISDLFKCTKNCLICNGDLCLKCQSDYILENSMCLLCGNGFINNDEECDDGNRMNNDGCSNQCQIQENWNCKQSIQSQSYCFRLTEITVELLNTTFNTQFLKLSYTNQVKLYSQDMEFLDFNINSINIDPSFYNLSVFRVIQIVSNETRTINYELKIQIYEQLIQNPILNVSVNLFLLDENDQLVHPSSKEIELIAPIVLSSTQLDISQKLKSSGYNLILALGIFAICAGLIGSFQLSLDILDILQFSSYLRFINVEYPENIHIYLQSSELVTVDPILNFLGIQDNFENQLGTNFILGVGKFYDYSINADLITNIYSQLTQAVSFLLLLVILKIYLVFCSKFWFKQSFINFVKCKQSKRLEYITIKLYNLNQYLNKQQNLDKVEMIVDWFYANNWDLNFKVLQYICFNYQYGIRTLISYIVCLAYLILGMFVVLRNFNRCCGKILRTEIRNQQHQLIIQFQLECKITLQHNVQLFHFLHVFTLG